jgi:formate-dependent nitrite reductase membrane component NrfD
MFMTDTGRVRYPQSVDPVRTDGRNVGDLGVLAGEGAQQNVDHADRHLKEITPTWESVPAIGGPDVTYYDRPVLKKSVWTIDIPLYYFLGGAAGAALTLGAAIQLVSDRRERRMRHLSAVCHWTGILGSTAGAALLIHDLGRPSRFLYMMRVFRPTSPMNMGVWILSGAAPTAITTGLFLNREGALGQIAEVTGYLSGLFGAALASYTGVLVANTAIPIWQEGRRWMPVLFAASGAATAGSVIDVLVPSSSCRVTRVFGTTGRLLEMVAAKKVEQAAGRVPKVAEPFERGAAGMLWKAAAVLTAASLITALVPGKSKVRMRAAGWLGIAGSCCLRFAVHYLGDASVQDPRAAFHQQRAG